MLVRSTYSNRSDNPIVDPLCVYMAGKEAAQPVSGQLSGVPMQIYLKGQVKCINSKLKVRFNVYWEGICIAVVEMAVLGADHSGTFYHKESRRI